MKREGNKIVCRCSGKRKKIRNEFKIFETSTWMAYISRFGLFLDTLGNSIDFPGAALALGHWALWVLQFDHSFWMVDFKGIHHQ